MLEEDFDQTKQSSDLKNIPLIQADQILLQFEPNFAAIENSGILITSKMRK